jgi:hypothetical protein
VNPDERRYYGAVTDNDSTKDAEKPTKVYRHFSPRAQFFKALTQMIIGGVAAIVVISLAIDLIAHHHTGNDIQNHVFTTIGVALAISAGIELVYTLFTPGPDEALDPLMLALSAAIILQLNKLANFDLKQAGAAVVYIAALAGTFAIRKYLSKEPEPQDWVPTRPKWLKRPKDL